MVFKEFKVKKKKVLNILSESIEFDKLDKLKFKII